MKPSAAACLAAATIASRRGVRRAVGDVVGDARAEDEGVLRHERDLGAKRLAGSSLAMSTPSSVTAPARGIVEAQRQLEERRLARAGRADDGDDFARRDAEADVVQDERPPLRPG